MSPAPILFSYHPSGGEPMAQPLSSYHYPRPLGKSFRQGWEVFFGPQKIQTRGVTTDSPRVDAPHPPGWPHPRTLPRGGGHAGGGSHTSKGIPDFRSFPSRCGGGGWHLGAVLGDHNGAVEVRPRRGFPQCGKGP